jgi:subtilase family serine protease
LVTLCLSILLSEGWLGPVTALLALMVPPEIKTFTVSLWVALGQILEPVVTTLCSFYLTVRVPDLTCFENITNCSDSLYVALRNILEPIIPYFMQLTSRCAVWMA